jgi:glyoxylase-like metal-dependent hydrolase (beta-lactamase superfamily II)
VDAIFDMQERGGKASPAQVKELQEARKVFEEVRPYGSRDVEGAYKKNPELVREVAGDEVLEGISFIPTPGHSIDHASIRLVSRGEQALFCRRRDAPFPAGV